MGADIDQYGEYFNEKFMSYSMAVCLKYGDAIDLYSLCTNTDQIGH